MYSASSVTTATSHTDYYRYSSVDQPSGERVSEIPTSAVSDCVATAAKEDSVCGVVACLQSVSVSLADKRIDWDHSKRPHSDDSAHPLRPQPTLLVICLSSWMAASLSLSAVYSRSSFDSYQFLSLYVGPRVCLRLLHSVCLLVIPLTSICVLPYTSMVLLLYPPPHFFTPCTPSSVVLPQLSVWLFLCNVLLYCVVLSVYSCLCILRRILRDI